MPEPGQRLFGRSLGPADTAVTVRVRDGRRQVTDGPISAAVRFLAGLDTIECADLDSALAAPATPTAPYLLLGWIEPNGPATLHDRGVIDAVEAWRRGVGHDGRYVMGSSFGGTEAAAALALRDPRTLAADSPFIQIADQLAAIDVIGAADRSAAIALAARHPLATGHAIEVRAFDPPL